MGASSKGVQHQIGKTAKERPPSRSQQQKIDTGLFSLVALLAYHDISPNPEQLSREFDAGRQGMDHRAIMRAAKSKGLKVRKIRSEIKRLHRVAMPAIAIAQDGSFFVIAKIGDQAVLVQEAGVPPAQWSLEEFTQKWSGGLIVFTRRAATPTGALKFNLRWFVPVMWHYRRLFSEVLLASLFLQLFALVTPLFFQVVIDKVLVHRGLTTLDVLVVGLITVTIFEVILGGLRTYVFAHTTSRIDAQLGAKLYAHLLALPVSYFECRPTGQTVARVRELETIREFITGSALTVVLDIGFTFVFFFVMYSFSPILTYIVLGSIPFYIVISIMITPVLRARMEEKFQRGAANQAFLVESVSSSETLKAMAVEPQMRQRWEEQLAAYVRSSFRTITLGTFGSQSVTMINKIVTALILWFGAKLAIAGELTIGQLVAFNMLSGQVNGPILRLARLWQDFQQFRISIERLGDILNTKPEIQPSAIEPNLPPLRGDISFERVVFRYKPGLPEVLNNINLHVRPGQVVGIVGRSGSGKSTLTKLIQKLYVPETGRILVDGIDTTLLDPSWLRRQIGVVLQDNVLFNRSVRDNIALANPVMHFDKVVAAAELSGAHEFILELPHGYDTIIEERGANLSGGQRQRIAIARALAIDPRILVFDEATAALDYESEQLIQDNMRDICRQRTVFLVAHRLSTVRHADRILFMEKGEIVEDASHDVLVKANGPYARLVEQAMG